MKSHASPSLQIKEIYSKKIEQLLFKRLRVQSYQEVMDRDYKQHVRLTKKQ